MHFKSAEVNVIIFCNWHTKTPKNKLATKRPTVGLNHLPPYFSLCLRVFFLNKKLWNRYFFPVHSILKSNLFTVVYFLLKNSISDLIDHKRILEGVQDLQDLYQWQSHLLIWKIVNEISLTIRVAFLLWHSYTYLW